MDKAEDYASDSDQSDEDFCPEFAGELPSEEDLSGVDEEGDAEEGTIKNGQKAKNRKKVLKKKTTKKQAKNDDSDEEDEDNDEGQKSSSRRRSTRQATDIGDEKPAVEKTDLMSDEDDKSRTDALWADFLSDVKQPAAAARAATSSTNKASSSRAAVATPTPTTTTNGRKPEDAAKSNGQAKTEEKEQPTEAAPKKIIVTEIVDFAGEEVRVQKTINVDNIKENKATVARAGGIRLPVGGLKRAATAAGGSGLGSILNQIGKKKKISVLEKTQLDWRSFKQDEGIEEELQTFNKGKDGYLERQDFLQRTDLRQFEIEKNLRQSRRNQ